MAPVEEAAIAGEHAIVAATKAPASVDATSAVDLLEGAVVEVIDPRLASIGVEPNTGEERDDAMPKNLHNAVELFIRTGNVASAQRLQRCTTVFFGLVDGRVDNSKAVSGRACICWACGHCGFERKAAPRVCNECGESQQTNYVNVTLSDGVAIPWRELPQQAVEDEVEIKVLTDGMNKLNVADSEDAGAKSAEQLAQDAKRAAIAAAVQASRDAQDAALDPLDPRLGSMRVLPNADEDNHPAFPKNLHNAMELLIKVKQVEQARQLQKCTKAYLSILDEGPQAAKSSGKGYVCFNCGFAGLAPEEGANSKSESGKACTCTSCGDDSHTNFVQLVLPTGMELPWMSREA
eukprot:TRINITY_DN41931_c0_g1_i1.p1 TRINITY_DN41931_c0_g1~~TRINITY_DN41931_c0_g1_i1.p1  ORF type:complete len:349 (-),score=98.64 TRINITY_DN41931_c0_g1_i1:126-1172(-)